jgi:hypothetical protein
MAMPAPLREVTVGIGLVGGGLAALVGVLALVGPRLILVKGALLEGKIAFQQFAASSANAAAILATSQNATSASVYKSAFAYGKMSTSQRQAAFDAYQLANAEKVQAAAAAGAIKVNQVLRAIEVEVAHVQESRLIIAQALTRAQVLQSEAMGAAASGNFIYARACIAAAEGELAVAEAANIEIAASKGTVRALTVEAAARNAARTAAIAQAEAEIAAAGAARGGAMAMGILGRAMGLLGGPVGWVITALTILVPLLFLLGKRHHEAASAATVNAQRQADVAAALKKQHAGATTAVRDMILMRLHALLGKNATDQFGYSLLQLYAIASGGGDAAMLTKFAATMSQANDAGKKGAAELFNEVMGIRQALTDQGAAAGGAAKGLDNNTAATNKNADAAKKAKKAQQDLKEAYDNINQALLSLPDALMAQRDASLAVVDAQKAYNKALDDFRHRATAVTKAENDLKIARLDQTKATEDVYNATQHLNRARQMAAAKTADAVSNLADANDHLYDAQDKVAQLEDELDKLRNGPTVEELTKATNKLADANLKLRKSQTQVRDAQYMLNYLQAEGASQYDLQAAQLNLDEANQNVANSTQDVADAQKELNDLKSPDPEVVAKKERELAAARRDVDSATRAITKAEQDLADARHNQAADTEYKAAEEEVLNARNALIDANQKVKDSEAALSDARKGTSLQEALTKAELDLEKALYQQAKANVEVQKQTALSQGKLFGYGAEARALADELSKIGAKSFSAQIDKDFSHFGTLLSNARRDVQVAKDDADSAASGIADSFSNAADDVGGIKFEPSFTPLEPKGKEAGSGWWDGFTKWFSDHVGTFHPLQGWDWGSGFDFGWLTNAWNTFMADASTSWHRSWNQTVDFGKWINDGLSNWVNSTHDDLAKIWSDGWGSIESKLASGFQKAIHFKDWILERLGIDKDTSATDIVAWFVSLFTGVPAGIVKWFADYFHIGEWLKNPFAKDKKDGDFTTKTAGEGWASSLVDGFRKWISDHLNPFSAIRDLLTNNEDATKTSSNGWGARVGKALVDGLIGWVVGNLNPYTLIRNILAGNEESTKTSAGGWGDRIGHKLVDALLSPLTGLPGLLGSAVTTAFKMLPDGMKGPINSAIDLWNRFVGYLANMKVNVPEFDTHVPKIGKIGGFTIGFEALNAFKIAPLAAGGILKQTVFAAGEAGPEAVIPLDRLFDMFNPVVDLVQQMKVLDSALSSLVSSQTSGQVFNTTVHVQTDADPFEISREIMWAHQTRLS